MATLEHSPKPAVKNGIEPAKSQAAPGSEERLREIMASAEYPEQSARPAQRPAPATRKTPAQLAKEKEAEAAAARAAEQKAAEDKATQDRAAAAQAAREADQRAAAAAAAEKKQADTMAKLENISSTRLPTQMGLPTEKGTFSLQQPRDTGLIRELGQFYLLGGTTRHSEKTNELIMSISIPKNDGSGLSSDYERRIPLPADTMKADGYTSRLRVEGAAREVVGEFVKMGVPVSKESIPGSFGSVPTVEQNKPGGWRRAAGAIAGVAGATGIIPGMREVANIAQVANAGMAIGDRAKVWDKIKKGEEPPFDPSAAVKVTAGNNESFQLTKDKAPAILSVVNRAIASGLDVSFAQNQDGTTSLEISKPILSKNKKNVEGREPIASIPYDYHPDKQPTRKQDSDLAIAASAAIDGALKR